MSNAGRRRYQQGQPSNDWLDRLTRFNLHFGRYFRDVFGVLLLALPGQVYSPCGWAGEVIC